MDIYADLDAIEKSPSFSAMPPDDRTTVLNEWAKGSHLPPEDQAPFQQAASSVLSERNSQLRARMPVDPATGSLKDPPVSLGTIVNSPVWQASPKEDRAAIMSQWTAETSEALSRAALRKEDALSAYAQVLQGSSLAAAETPEEAAKAADAEYLKESAADAAALKVKGFKMGRLKADPNEEGEGRFTVSPNLALGTFEAYSKAIDSDASASPVEKLRAKALYDNNRAAALGELVKTTQNAVSGFRIDWKNAIPSLSPAGPTKIDTVTIAGKEVDWDQVNEIAVTKQRIANYAEKGASQEALFSDNPAVRKEAEIRAAKQLATHVLPAIGADDVAKRILENPESPEAKALVEQQRDVLKQSLWVPMKGLKDNAFEKVRVLSDGSAAINPAWALTNPQDAEAVAKAQGVSKGLGRIQEQVTETARKGAENLIAFAEWEDGAESVSTWSAIVAPSIAVARRTFGRALPAKFAKFIADKKQAGITDPLTIVQAYEKEFGTMDSAQIGFSQAGSQVKQIGGGIAGILSLAGSDSLAKLAGDIMKDTAREQQLQEQLTGPNSGIYSSAVQSIATELPFMAGGVVAGRLAAGARTVAGVAAQKTLVANAMRTASVVSKEALEASMAEAAKAGSNILRAYGAAQASRSFGGMYQSAYLTQKETALRLGKTEEEADRSARLGAVVPAIAAGAGTYMLMKAFPGGTEAALERMATNMPLKEVVSRVGKTNLLNALKDRKIVQATADLLRKHFPAPAAKRAGLVTIAGMLDEGAEEMADELLQSAITNVFDETITLQKSLENAAHAGALGAWMGAVSSSMANVWDQRQKAAEWVTAKFKAKPLGTQSQAATDKLRSEGDTETADALEEVVLQSAPLSQALKAIPAGTVFTQPEAGSDLDGLVHVVPDGADANTVLEEIRTSLDGVEGVDVSLVDGNKRVLLRDTTDPTLGMTVLEKKKSWADTARGKMDAEAAGGPNVTEEAKALAETRQAEYLSSGRMVAEEAKKLGELDPKFANPTEGTPLAQLANMSRGEGVLGRAVKGTTSRKPVTTAAGVEPYLKDRVARKQKALDTAKSTNKPLDKIEDAETALKAAQADLAAWTDPANKDFQEFALQRATAQVNVRTAQKIQDDILQQYGDPEEYSRLFGPKKDKAPAAPAPAAGSTPTPTPTPTAAPAPAPTPAPAAPRPEVKEADILAALMEAAKNVPGYAEASDKAKELFHARLEKAAGEYAALYDRASTAADAEQNPERKKALEARLTTFAAALAGQGSVSDAISRLRGTLKDSTFATPTNPLQGWMLKRDVEATKPEEEKKPPVAKKQATGKRDARKKGSDEKKAAEPPKAEAAPAPVAETPKAEAPKEPEKPWYVRFREALNDPANVDILETNEVDESLRSKAQKAAQKGKDVAWDDLDAYEQQQVSDVIAGKRKRGRAPRNWLERFASHAATDAASAEEKRVFELVREENEDALPWRMLSADDQNIIAAVTGDDTTEAKTPGHTAIWAAVTPAVDGLDTAGVTEFKARGVRGSGIIDKIADAADAEETVVAVEEEVTAGPGAKEVPLSLDDLLEDVAAAPKKASESTSFASRFVDKNARDKGTIPVDVANAAAGDGARTALALTQWKTVLWFLRQFAKANPGEYDTSSPKYLAVVKFLTDLLEGMKASRIEKKLSGLGIEALKDIVFGSEPSENAQVMSWRKYLDLPWSHFRSSTVGSGVKVLENKLAAERRARANDQKASDARGVLEGDNTGGRTSRTETRTPETSAEDQAANAQAFRDAVLEMGGDATDGTSMLEALAGSRGRYQAVAKILLASKVAAGTTVRVVEDPNGSPAYFSTINGKPVITFNPLAKSVRGVKDDVIHEFLHALTDKLLGTTHPDGSPQANAVASLLDLQKKVRARVEAALDSWKDVVGEGEVPGTMQQSIEAHAESTPESVQREFLAGDPEYSPDMTAADVLELYFVRQMEASPITKLQEQISDFEYALGLNEGADFYSSGLSVEFVTHMMTDPWFMDAVDFVASGKEAKPLKAFDRFVRAIKLLVDPSRSSQVQYTLLRELIGDTEQATNPRGVSVVAGKAAEMADKAREFWGGSDRRANTRTVGYRPSRPRRLSQEEIDIARQEQAAKEEERRRKESEDWEAFKAMSPEERLRKEAQDREASERAWEQYQKDQEQGRVQSLKAEADAIRKEEERALADARDALARMPRPVNPQDAEYIDAAVSGDVDRARSILDSAARSKGYPDTVFRGSEMDELTAYDRPVWVAVSRSLAELYSKRVGGESGYVRPMYFDKGESLELWKFRYWPEVVEYIASRGAVPAKVERLKEEIARTLWPNQFDEGPPTWDNFAARYDRYREDRGEDDEDGGMLWDPDGGNIPSSWMTEDQGGRTANNRALVDTLFGFGFDSISQLEGAYDPADGATYVVRDSARLKSADLVTYDDEGNPVLPSQRFNDQVTDIRYTRTPAARLPVSLRPAPGSFEEDAVNSAYNAVTSGAPNGYTLADAPLDEITHLLNADVREAIAAADRKEKTRSGDTLSALENLARPYAYAIAGPAGVPTAPGTSGPLKAFSQTGLRLRSRIAASHGFLTPASLPYGDRMHDITEALTTLTELIGPERTVAYLTAVDPMKVPAGAQKARAQIHKHLPLVSRRTLARVFTGNTFADPEQGIEYSVAPLQAEGVGIGRSVLWHELTGARAALEGFRDREAVALVEGGKILSVTRGTLEKPAEASDAEKQAWMTEHGAVEDGGVLKVRDAAGFVRVVDALYTLGEVTFADGPGLLAEGDVHEGVRYNTRRAGMGRKAFFSVKGAFLNYGRSMTPAEVRADYHERFLGIRTGVMGMVTQEGVWGKALYNIKKENEAGLAAVFTTVDRLERHLSRTKQGLAPQVVADVDMVLGTIDDVYDEAMRKAAVKARSEGRRAVLKAASAARKAASALVGDERKLRIREADKEQNDELARLETEYSDAMIAAAEKGRLAFLARRDQSIQRLKDGKYDDALKAALALRGHLDNLQGTMTTKVGIDERVKAHFSARGGIHLTRSYQIHDDPHYARWIGSTDPVAVAKRQAALNWIRDNRKERFAKEFLAKNPTADAATVDAYATSATASIPEYAILSELDQILDKHSRKGGTGVAGAMNASIFLERSDVPKPIRELLGEYRDHTAAAVRTALEMGIYYANYRMFDDIKTKLEEHEAARVKRVDDLDKKERSKGLTPEEAKEFNDLKATRFFTTDDKEGVTHGLLQFSPDTRGLRSSAYGPLQGGYGPEVVVRAIQELNEARNSNLAFDLYAKFLGQVMAAVTTRNLRGQARNFAASLLYVPASGMMSLALPVIRANDTDLPGLAGKVVKKFGAFGGRRLKERIAAVGEREAFDEFFQLYASAGIIGGSERAAIMEDMRKMAGLDSDAMLQQAMERHFKKFSALPVGVANAATALKNLDKFAGDLYQGSDDYFKRIIFDMTYDNYLAAFGVPIFKGKAEYSDAQVDRIIEVYDGKGLLTPSSEKETENDRKARADRLIVAAAAQATFASIPFYNRLPEGLNWLQKSKLSAVFAPLTKYPAAVLQMPILLTRQAMFDMQTPETRMLGVRRIASTLATFTMASAVTSTVVRAIIYALSMLPGGDDKLEVLAPSLVSGARERALKDLVTNPYYKNRDLSLIAMRGNNPVWVDLSYLNPFAVYSDMMAPLMSSRSRETMGDFQDAVAETVSTVPKMFFSPQLPIQEIYKIASDPTYDAQERRSTIGLGRDITAGLVKMAIPLTFKDLAATGEAYGTSRFMPQLLSTGLGFKVQETDVAEALRSSLGKADKFEAETMDQVRRMLGSRKSVDPADLRAAYVEGLDNRRALLVELDRARKAAAMFFGDDAKARRIMFDSGRGLGQANVRALLDGHMRQWDPSAMTWERAAERGKDNADNRVETMRRLMRGTPEQIPLYESIEVK